MVSMFSLEGKNAAVVGGASGIGEAVAIAFAEHGASVLCLDVDITGALDTAATITDMGGDCLLYTSPSPRDGLLSRMPSSA